MEALEEYRSFIRWLCKLLFSCLSISSSFPRNNSALQCLFYVHSIIGLSYGSKLLNRSTNCARNSSQNCEEKTYLSADVDCAKVNEQPSCSYPTTILNPYNVQTLLQCLADSYDVNKVLAFDLLVSFSDEVLGFNNEDRLKEFLMEALELAASNKPTSSVTASFVLRLLVYQPKLCSVVSRLLTEEDAERIAKPEMSVSSEANTVATRTVNGNLKTDIIKKENAILSLLSLLLDRLSSHVDVARQSLLRAAVSHPIYGIIHCIRHVLGEVDGKAVLQNTEWRKLINNLIEHCFLAAKVVSPVVTNNSPEGHLPMDTGEFFIRCIPSICYKSIRQMFPSHRYRHV